MTNEQWIELDGEKFELDVNDLTEQERNIYQVKTESGEEFILCLNQETAGVAAREFWEDMANNDPSEFACIVGEATLIAWGLGQWAGPGSTQTRSLEEWLDLWTNTPEEHFASYDSDEREVTGVSDGVTEDLGFEPTVAYRSN